MLLKMVRGKTPRLCLSHAGIYIDIKVKPKPSIYYMHLRMFTTALV